MNLTTLGTSSRWNGTVFSLLGLCPQGSTKLQHVLEFSSFLRLNTIPLYVYATFCLSVHPWMDIWVAFTLRPLCRCVFKDRQLCFFHVTQFRRPSHGRVGVPALLKGVEEDTVWPPWLGTHILAQSSHLLCEADEIIPVYNRRRKLSPQARYSLTS